MKHIRKKTLQETYSDAWDDLPPCFWMDISFVPGTTKNLFVALLLIRKHYSIYTTLSVMVKPVRLNFEI